MSSLQTVTVRHLWRTGHRSRIRGPDDKQPILLLTTHRSGSSFVGRILFEHPNITYLFEPQQLIQTEPTVERTTEPSAIISYFKKLFNCSFEDALHDINERHLRPQLSSDLCSAFLRHFTEYETRESRLCTVGEINKLQQSCRRHSQSVALKVIRIHENQLHLVRDLLRDEAQVIHLFRDPRGIINSPITVIRGKSKQARRYYSKDNFDSLVKRTSHYCKRISHDLDMTASWMAAEPWFSHFYHLVRYEDFAYHPENTARRLYSAIGMSMHDSVLAWLRKATHNKYEGHNVVYATTRVSTQTAEAWRYKLPFDCVSAVQNLTECQYVMRKLGYVVAQPEAMLLRKSIGLVKLTP